MSTLTAIITRTKNRPLLLKRAIYSVLNQTQENWTHIIVNDGGDSAPVEALGRENAKKYNGRLKIIHNNRSHGMEAASNIGIAQSHSDYILIHDDDDSLNERFLEKTMAYIDNPPYPTIHGVATLTLQIDEKVEGDLVSKVSEKQFRALGGCLSAAQIAEVNQIPPISFLFRRQAYTVVGPFDESLPVLGDWDFLLRFIAKFDVGVIPEALANYHVRSASSGIMANSVIDKSNHFALYEGIVRNRMLRSETYNPALAALLQQGFSSQRLRRLYEHPVIGGFIRLWSKFINRDIPRMP
ncbi:glycosyltransferase family 2 protein [Dyella flava]|uniref:Glycosyltransferase n=1 Tax=Dyella flava TaxID=1920170 RepID=A0ABS2K6T6_9GAMM|nr:glycosyltransferase [Dyella flava]MBM7126864.1 glycosyltransferase [Dyella flava]GLQ50376.1 hypothetical protein GCM10010872_18250 [Dyella flava]